MNDSGCDDIIPTDVGNPSKGWLFISLLAIAFVTVCCNVYLIFKINRHRVHKPLTRFFLTSLAFTDLCVGMIIMPFNAYNVSFGSRNIFSNRMCDVMNSFDVMISSSSIFHLMILTFERYVGLCKPFSYPRWCSIKLSGLLYTGCWSISVCISFGLILPGVNYHGVDIHVRECFNFYMDNTSKCTFIYGRMYMIISSLTTIFVPMLTIVYLNYKVVTYIRARCNNQSLGITGKFANSHRAKCVHIFKILAVLTVCFLVCWLPFFIANAVVVLSDYSVPYIFYTCLTWLGYLCSTLNPILYIRFQGKNNRLSAQSSISINLVNTWDVWRSCILT